MNIIIYIEWKRKKKTSCTRAVALLAVRLPAALIASWHTKSPLAGGGVGKLTEMSERFCAPSSASTSQGLPLSRFHYGPRWKRTCANGLHLGRRVSGVCGTAGRKRRAEANGREATTTATAKCSSHFVISHVVASPPLFFCE